MNKNCPHIEHYKQQKPSNMENRHSVKNVQKHRLKTEEKCLRNKFIGQTKLRIVEGKVSRKIQVYI